MKLTHYATIIGVTAITLVACVPSNVPRATMTNIPEQATFYPQQTGLRWMYHYPNEPLDTPPITTEIVGPTRRNGKTLTIIRTVGRGYDLTKTYEIGLDGVLLHHEDRPGVTITYDPPIQELPPAINLTVGHSWRGTTRTTIRFQTNPTPTTYALTYEYTILERRTIQTPAGTHDTLLINLTANDETQTIQQRTHFAPFIGTIINPDGSILTQTNATTGAQP